MISSGNSPPAHTPFGAKPRELIRAVITSVPLTDHAQPSNLTAKIRRWGSPTAVNRLPTVPGN